MDVVDVTPEVVLGVIREYHGVNGYYPTYREIQRRLGMSSPSVVMPRIEALEQSGKLRKRVDGHKMIVWCEPKTEVVTA